MLGCDELRPRLTELALGDLDVEPARDVREHLARCAACRAEEAAVGRALGLLKAPLAPSTERRLSAIRVMAETRKEVPTRRRWAVAAAAAVVLAGGFLIWKASHPGAVLKAAEVVGRADHFRASEGRFSPLAPGDRIWPGDRVVVAGGGRVRLEGPGAAIVIESGGALGVASGGRLALERGVLRLEASGGPALRVLDSGNDMVTLLRGRATIGLREVRGTVAGSFETKGSGQAPPEAREVTAQRLTVSVAEGDVDLDGSLGQRLRASSGQEGGFEFDGRPFTKGAGGER